MSIDSLMTLAVTALTAFLAGPSVETGKQLRKSFRNVERSHDGRVPEALRPAWKQLSPVLGAYIDGRQSSQDAEAAARTLAETIDAIFPKDPAPAATEQNNAKPVKQRVKAEKKPAEPEKSAALEPAELPPEPTPEDAE